jgi:2-polyprenyl-3-methyl-5-hydroxy-6-metoxy-1,4-benzoquinol methylase
VAFPFRGVSILPPLSAPAPSTAPSTRKVSVQQALSTVGNELGDMHYYNLQFRRYKWVVDTVERYLKPGSAIADIGSAPGHLSMTLSDLGYKVTAFDFDPGSDMWESTPDGSFAKSLQKRGVPLKHWDVEVGDPADVPTGEVHGQFDCVIFTEILEHVYRYPFATVRQVAHLLKPGGICIVTTPNRGSLPFRLKFLAGMPCDTPLNLLHDYFPPHMRHVWLYTPKEVQTVLHEANLETVESNVQCFHLWTTTISTREILPYWRPTNIKQMLKPALALIYSVLPELGDTVCCVARKV